MGALVEHDGDHQGLEAAKPVVFLAGGSPDARRGHHEEVAPLVSPWRTRSRRPGCLPRPERRGSLCGSADQVAGPPFIAGLAGQNTVLIEEDRAERMLSLMPVISRRVKRHAAIARASQARSDGARLQDGGGFTAHAAYRSAAGRSDTTRDAKERRTRTGEHSGANQAAADTTLSAARSEAGDRRGSGEVSASRTR